MRGLQALQRFWSLDRFARGQPAYVAHSVPAMVASRSMQGVHVAATASFSTAASQEEEVVLDATPDHADLRVAMLNRPKALNSLNLAMVTRLRELYEEWESNPQVKLLLLKSQGRAFCAGGDVRTVHRLGSSGDVAACKEFFWWEYQVNYLLATLRKPQVALINGVVMGGGNGIAMHGRFRVATENAVFAMPETAIGLHPDVGASYFLARLPGHLGEFLGLTGTRLDAADMLAVELATHVVPAESLGRLEERLRALHSSDPEVLHLTLLEYSEQPDRAANSPLHGKKLIDECFGKDTVEGIVAALEEKAEAGEEWCKAPLAALRKASPTSLKVSLRSIREGRRQPIAACLKREYRLTVRCLEATTSPDFYEGVRALLVDKDNAPKWNPPTLEKVTKEMVDQHFAPLPADQELDLPVAQRERRHPSHRSRL